MQCPSRHYAKGACEGAFISVDRLERMVIAELKRLNAEYLDMDELARKVQFNTNLLDQKKKIEAEFATYQGRIEQFSKAVRDLYPRRKPLPHRALTDSP